MIVPLTHFLLLTQVICCTDAQPPHRKGSADAEGRVSTTTAFRMEHASFGGSDFDVCPATLFGQCRLLVNEPWADDGHVYGVQKADWISAASGREAGTNMIVPLTHFLLLTQVICCTDAQPPHRKGSADAEGRVSTTTAFRMEHASFGGNDFDVCPATLFGQCRLLVNEPWADDGHVYGVQKADWISAASGREAGTNMIVPLTHFLLLTQVLTFRETYKRRNGNFKQWRCPFDACGRTRATLLSQRSVPTLDGTELHRLLPAAKWARPSIVSPSVESGVIQATITPNTW
ncbi:uncharacterized protein [Dermacentor albipictus]|uniref:uncharacterized protein isoform X1 n=1 Tax=Dermacentor albipictus TaxID=60249 RepID=UPI0038FC26C1